MIIELPLPPQVLHPNSRTRAYGYRARMVREARATAAMLARQSKPTDCPWPAATVIATFYLPRRNDGDNLVAWIKPYLDGLQDAGIVANDSKLDVMTPKQEKSKERKLILDVRRLLGDRNDKPLLRKAKSYHGIGTILVLPKT